MSTPPKDSAGTPRTPSPKPGAGNALESTFLGVAPAVPEPAHTPPSTPAGGSGGSAIIAAPMISVSGDRRPRQPATPVAPAAPTSPAAPVRPAALQGGWQSAGVARPQSPDQTAVQGTPGAWPMPPARGDAAGAQTHVGRAAPAQQSAPPPSPYPAPAYPAQPQPPQPAAAGGGLHHTALASDYLRAAREAALGGAVAPLAPRAGTPAAPLAAPYAAQEPSGPPTQMPVSDPVPTAPPARPVSVYPSPAPSVAPASAAPPTAAPPATSPLSDAGPLPLPMPTYQPALAYAPEPDAMPHGPRSIGTQASVAPPLSSATPAAAPTALSPAALSPAALSPAAHAAVSPAPNPVRQAGPAAMAGTMLDRTPSIPGGALPAPPTAPPVSSVSPSATAAFATRFEQVPSARGSLAQQQTGFGLHIPIDQSASDWGRANLDQTGAGRPKEKPASQLRLIVLAALAVAAIGFATFGKQWVGGASRSPTDGIRQPAAEDEGTSPKQATLTNLPGTAQPAPTPVAPTGSPAPTTSSAAASPPGVAAAPAAPAVLPSVPVEEKAEPAEPADSKAAEAARKEAEASASPESKLAAQAARHVLVARYSDALPLYRQLQQSYPQNTAYAAMVRVLEQKTATSAKGAQP